MLIAPKNAKATDFKFGRHARRDSPDVTTQYFFSKMGRRQGHVTSWLSGVNANSFEMVTVTNFKFGVHAQRNPPNKAIEIIFEKEAW